MGLADRPEAGLAARTGVRRQDRSLAALGRISLASQRNLLRVLRFHRILSRKPVSTFRQSCSADSPDLALSRGAGRVVERQQLSELRTGAAQAALDRADPHFANDSGFLIREAARADQRQHLALLGWQPRQGPAEIFQVEMALLVARNREPARIKAVAILDLAGAFAIIRIVDVAQDGEQPCPQAGPGLELLRVAPGAQKRFLDKIVGERNRARQGNRERAQILDFPQQPILEASRWHRRSPGAPKPGLQLRGEPAVPRTFPAAAPEPGRRSEPPAPVRSPPRPSGRAPRSPAPRWRSCEFRS